MRLDLAARDPDAAGVEDVHANHAVSLPHRSVGRVDCDAAT
jgi:hypothetical protein